jgi:hypothetical protein
MITNLSSQAFPDEGFGMEPEGPGAQEISKVLPSSRQVKYAAAVTGGAGAGGVAGKYVGGELALHQHEKNPEKVQQIAQRYKGESGGRRPFTPKGIAHSKAHPDLVTRKLHHGITSWEDKPGVRLQRRIAAGDKRARLHPRYAEHKLLAHATAKAPLADRQLYRGVTMHPEEAKKLAPGQRHERGIESWSDQRKAAEGFADARIKARKKERDYVRVTYQLPKKSSALNIQGVSNYKLHEWTADKPYEIKTVRQRKAGHYHVTAQQVGKSMPDAADVHVIGGGRGRLRPMKRKKRTSG